MNQDDMLRELERLSAQHSSEVADLQKNVTQPSSLTEQELFARLDSITTRYLELLQLLDDPHERERFIFSQQVQGVRLDADRRIAVQTSRSDRRKQQRAQRKAAAASSTDRGTRRRPPVKADEPSST